MDKQQATDMIERLAASIGEHFDAVQIMVSWVDEGSTCAVSKGTGNFYARLGLAHEFILLDAAKEQAIEIAERLNPDV